MNQQILKHLKDYSYDTWDVNRLLVSSFVIINNIKVVQNQFIKTYIVTETQEIEYAHLQKFVSLFNEQDFGIEELIEFFEFVISPVDKEINGAVYTPEHIRKYIVNNSITKRTEIDNVPLHNLRFADIACGCGGFFKTITENLKTHTSKSYSEIFRENIFGLDIQEYSIIRTKILLCLMAILDNEDQPEYTFNLFCGDALTFNWAHIFHNHDIDGFDIVVGNPPYVGVTKMNIETRLLMKNWAVAQSGKPDLYIPFFEIGINTLKDSGVLGYITVNTFFKSLNGRLLRTFFSSNKWDLTIIDFGGEQVFKSRSTYTCICIIRKQQIKDIKYLKTPSSQLNKIISADFVHIPYSKIDDYEGWHLIQNQQTEIINKIEASGRALGDEFIIRNGFATLKNSIFLFTPVSETKDFYQFLKDGNLYNVEKEICRDAIKPNTLKSESEIVQKKEKLIFPYKVSAPLDNLFGPDRQKLEIISELFFKETYPLAYNYLLSNKLTLSKRDKGTKDYEQWYAFGRNQALTISGYKLLFPYISSKPCFVFTDEQDLLFYNGYAIVSDSKEALLVLQKILMSNIFWYYIKHTSKPYSGDFFSIAKNYIKKFSICQLTHEEKKKILVLPQEEVDIFLQKKYNINIKI